MSSDQKIAFCSGSFSSRTSTIEGPMGGDHTAGGLTANSHQKYFAPSEAFLCRAALYLGASPYEPYGFLCSKYNM